MDEFHFKVLNQMKSVLDLMTCVMSTLLPLSNSNAQTKKNVKWLTHLTKGMKYYLELTEQ